MSVSPSRVEAQEVVLRGADGKIQASLVATDDGPVLQLLDIDEKKRVLLSLNRISANLFLQSPDQSSSLQALAMQGSASLSICIGDLTVALSARNTGGASLLLQDKGTNKAAMLSIEKDSSNFTLFHHANQPIAEISVSDQGVECKLLDQNGNVFARLGY